MSSGLTILNRMTFDMNAIGLDDMELKYIGVLDGIGLDDIGLKLE